jgi:DNA-binding XRE family transcriptional regulator
VTRRIKAADLQPLTTALRKTRAALGVRQAEMAEHLGISRKTYVLLESSRWHPPYKERAAMLKRLHELDPELVPTFLGVTGATLDEHALVVEVQAPRPPRLSAEQLKDVYEKAIAEVATEREMTLAATRKVAGALLRKLAAAGVEMADVAGIGT